MIVLSYSLGEASVVQETEDKFNTMLLTFKRQGQSEEDALHLRLLDKVCPHAAPAFFCLFVRAMTGPSFASYVVALF